MTTSMELRHLAAAVAVADVLNFSLAAQRLHITQPALSRQIRDLEAMLRERLFHRTTHAVSLTPAGAVFVEQARRILGAADDAVIATRRAAAGTTGSVRIGFIGSLAHTLLPTSMAAMRRACPDIDMHPVEAGPNEQLDRLRDHRLDVGYIGLISPEAHPDLQVRELARFPLRVVLPADHRLARRAHVRVSDLVGESLILTEHANAPLYNRWLCSALAEAGVTLPVSRTTGRAAAVLALVAAGCGISCFPAPVLDLPHPGAVALRCVGCRTTPSASPGDAATWRRRSTAS
jgi:DNA-binding transcriptional LysR family regulator